MFKIKSCNAITNQNNENHEKKVPQDLDLAGIRLHLYFGQGKEKRPSSTDGGQVETIRVGKDNQTGGTHTEGRGKLPGTGGESNFKIKQEVKK